MSEACRRKRPVLHPHEYVGHRTRKPSLIGLVGVRPEVVVVSGGGGRSPRSG